MHGKALECLRQGATVDGLTEDLNQRDMTLAEMQDRWNFLSFKHQLLIDMVRVPSATWLPLYLGGGC